MFVYYHKTRNNIGPLRVRTLEVNFGRVRHSFRIVFTQTHSLQARARAHGKHVRNLLQLLRCSMQDVDTNGVTQYGIMLTEWFFYTLRQSNELFYESHTHTHRNIKIIRRPLTADPPERIKRIALVRVCMKTTTYTAAAVWRRIQNGMPASELNS